MKVLYDRETDTLTIVLREDAVQESDEIKEGIILDYDQNGRVISLELLNASHHVKDPGSIAYELHHAA